MPDPSYVIETAGKQAGLAFHLETAFYPPLPGFVKTAFVAAFKKYWDYEIDIDGLSTELREEAGYIGDLGSYNLPQFFNEEDLIEW